MLKRLQIGSCRFNYFKRDWVVPVGQIVSHFNYLGDNLLIMQDIRGSTMIEYISD